MRKPTKDLVIELSVLFVIVVTLQALGIWGKILESAIVHVTTPTDQSKYEPILE